MCWDLHHEYVQVTGIIDLVRRHLPLGRLDDETRGADGGLEVSYEPCDADGQQDQILLRFGPVERIVWIFGRLRDQDSLTETVSMIGLNKQGWWWYLYTGTQ